MQNHCLANQDALQLEISSPFLEAKITSDKILGYSFLREPFLLLEKSAVVLEPFQQLVPIKMPSPNWCSQEHIALVDIGNFTTLSLCHLLHLQIWFLVRKTSKTVPISTLPFLNYIFFCSISIFHICVIESLSLSLLDPTVN